MAEQPQRVKPYYRLPDDEASDDMKLWILWRKSSHVPRGNLKVNNGFTVRAATASQARQIANDAYLGEGAIWQDAQLTFCKEIDLDFQPGIVANVFSRQTIHGD